MIVLRVKVGQYKLRKKNQKHNSSQNWLAFKSKSKSKGIGLAQSNQYTISFFQYDYDSPCLFPYFNSILIFPLCSILR